MIIIRCYHTFFVIHIVDAYVLNVTRYAADYAAQQEGTSLEQYVLALENVWREALNSARDHTSERKRYWILERVIDWHCKCWQWHVRASGETQTVEFLGCTPDKGIDVRICKIRDTEPFKETRVNSSCASSCLSSLPLSTYSYRVRHRIQV